MLLNLNAGTTFDVSENALLRVRRLSVTNALNALYVSDATNNSQYAPNPYGIEGGKGRQKSKIGPPRGALECRT